jgi:hypothetical protein
MSGERNRLIAFWATAEHRARIWFWLFVLQSTALLCSLGETRHLLYKPLQVIRVGCDGIPNVIRLDEEKYSEPTDAEVRAFATNFIRYFARADSGSVVNDYAWCGQHMAPNLRAVFVRDVKRTRATTIVEDLKARADIDPSSMKIEVDTRPYPWRVKVSAVRRSVSETSSEPVDTPIEVELQVVKTPRSEVIEGLLVWRIDTKSGPVGVPDGGLS